MLVDPDGKEAMMAGTGEQRQTNLNDMQKLTNDRLGMRSDGTVMIVNTGVANSDKDLASGTALVRDVINNSNTVVIAPGSTNQEFDVSPGATNGGGSNVLVKYNPSFDPKEPTIDPKTGNASMETRPNQIGLGHELVHTERSMNGKAVPTSQTTDYTYKGPAGKPITDKNVPKEELQTVGLQGDSKYTENKLREEQNLNQRGGYYGQ